MQHISIIKHTWELPQAQFVLFMTKTHVKFNLTCFKVDWIHPKYTGDQFQGFRRCWIAPFEIVIHVHVRKSSFNSNCSCAVWFDYDDHGSHRDLRKIYKTFGGEKVSANKQVYNSFQFLPFVLDKEITWYEANSICEKEKSNLASVNSWFELLYMIQSMQLLMKLQELSSVYIGLVKHNVSIQIYL